MQVAVFQRIKLTFYIATRNSKKTQDKKSVRQTCFILILSVLYLKKFILLILI